LFPYPCGHFGDPTHECTCSMQVIGRYMKRISGPLLNRIDLRIEVPRVDYEKLSDERTGGPREAIQPVQGAAVATVLRYPAV